MLGIGDPAPAFRLLDLNGQVRSVGASPTLLVFFQTDCPTCSLAFTYLNRLAARMGQAAQILGLSQDPEDAARGLLSQEHLEFPLAVDQNLALTRLYGPLAVPSFFLIDSTGTIAAADTAFDKQALNEIASKLSELTGTDQFILAEPYDGSPQSKPGCTSRHLESSNEPAGPGLTPITHSVSGKRAAVIELDDSIDLYEYCFEKFGDPLPVIPPTVGRVERMLSAVQLDSATVVSRIPPNYGAATIEKIAANAVMAGCRPEMMRVLIPLVRASCDERFNLHGVQATTHFAAPLVIVNGPIRIEMGFACGSNLFSNVSRANSTLGRALQLILVNLGGAHPGEIDMSTLGNPGKFSFCIAENEEQSPWTPLHVEMGFNASESTITLFAAEMPRGVSEHNARNGKTVLKAICAALATVWSYRVCAGQEAIVILCPEHVKTIHRDGLTKQDAREYLFENTGVPVSSFAEDGGEGTQYGRLYTETTIDGVQCYRKFQTPESIRIVVAGGTAGKFSAVIGGWATGPRGSQMVTYPIGTLHS